MPQMHFRTNAKVERLVGRELITNNTTAIFELVKNSYDAGARKVEIKFGNFLPNENNNGKIVTTPNSFIQVTDNGKGMTRVEIEKYWMELGTPNKENNKQQNVRFRKGHVETVAKRMVNGEKGIGRFGVDKIGSFLTMESIDESLTEKTIVYFDWSKFDDTKKLIEHIPCEYELIPVKSGEHSGLKLTIKGLRDDWSWRDIENLKRSLKKFLSPINIQQDEFKIIFIYPEVVNGNSIEKREEIINDAFDYLKTDIYAELDMHGNLYYEITDQGILEESRESKLYPKSSFGAVKVKIYYLNSEAKSQFTKKMGMRTNEYGNIQIFKDNFRILPYGEPHNDWLEIDNRHAQGVFRTFGTRDLVGYALLSHDPANKNKALKEATDRMGLVEDVPEFNEFRDFVKVVIELLETFIFTKIQRKAKETTQILKRESINIKHDTNTLLASLKNTIKHSDLPSEQRNTLIRQIDGDSIALLQKISTVENASKEIEKKIKIYSQITSKEGVLYDTLHAIKNKLAIIDAQLKEFDLEISKSGLNIDTNELSIAFQAICKMVERALNKVTGSKLRKQVMPVSQLIDEAIESFSPRLRQKGIIVKNIFKANGAMVRCSLEAIKTNVLENLFDNAVKALNNTQDKQITILTKKNEGYVEIFFSDNGVGIPEEKASFIFSLWGSNTGGSGIGLATAKDTLEDHDGEIAYVDIGEEDKKTTFLIKIPMVPSTIN